MNFNDSGIIISHKKYGEDDAIVKIFCQEHGIYRGFVNKISSRKNRPIFQIGNLISFEWRSRVEDGLGSFYYVDLAKSFMSKIMFDKLKLNCLIAIFSIIENYFLERESYPELYDELLEFMNKIVFEEVDNKELLMDYVKIELKILEVLGYGVDLSCCAVTNSQENLIFVSPKSARAVCGEAGMPYESKLLKLPRFLTGDLENVIIEEIGHGFKLSGYFLEKFVFSQNKLNLTARSSIESELFKLAQ